MGTILPSSSLSKMSFWAAATLQSRTSLPKLKCVRALLGRHLAEFVQYAAHFFPAVGNGEVVAGGNYADAVYGKQFVQLDAFEPVLAGLAVCLLGDEKVVGRLRDEGLPRDAVQCFVL